MKIYIKLFSILYINLIYVKEVRLNYIDSGYSIPEVENELHSNGYILDRHYIKTYDGYILELHRLYRNGTFGELKSKSVVLGMHGMTSSSMEYIVMGPELGLGYYFVEKGYDVWLGNARGNKFSSKHETLHPNMTKYWEFSWDLIATIDLPAIIDYVLKTSKKESLHYVGYSQGGALPILLVSSKPEYNSKFKTLSLLAPSVYMSYTTSPLMKKLFNAIIPKFNSNMFERGFPSFEGNNTKRLLNICLCILPICTSLVNYVVGPSTIEKDWDKIVKNINYYNLGWSLQQILHISQQFNKTEIRWFDYGSMMKNLVHYYWTSPPTFDFSGIIIPKIAIFYGSNDMIVSIESIFRLSFALSRPVNLVEIPGYNHLDFIWSSSLQKDVADEILKVIQQGDKKTKNIT